MGTVHMGTAHMDTAHMNTAHMDTAHMNTVHVDTGSWHCSSCGGVREFVQPECLDGHTDDGGECPEWACVDCGGALLVGAVVPAGVEVRARIAA